MQRCLAMAINGHLVVGSSVANSLSSASTPALVSVLSSVDLPAGCNHASVFQLSHSYLLRGLCIATSSRRSTRAGMAVPWLQWHATRSKPGTPCGTMAPWHPPALV